MATPGPARPRCTGCGASPSRGLPGSLCPACLLALALGDGEPGVIGSESGDRTYEILAILAGDDVRTSYLARDEGGRLVTLDVVTRAVALEPPATGAEPQAISFERRLKGLCALDHPGIVPVLDGRLTAEHHFCLVMQYVPGPTLEWGAPGRWGAGEIARAFDRICEALSFAHDRSVAHGALGPSSVVLPAGRDDADPVLTGWAPWVGPGAAKEDVEGLARLLSALVHGRPVAFRLESVLREAASFSSVGSLRRAAGPILQQ